MKNIRTIFMAVVILSFISSVAKADNTTDNTTGEQSIESLQKRNTVWILGVDSDHKDIWKIKGRAITAYTKTIKKGFQQSGVPNFIISDPSNKAVFGIGGFVNMRTAYDWNNVIGSRDFVTSSIPMQSDPSNKQRYLMDVSTTRLFFKTIVRTNHFGQLEAYVETDFRGSGNALHLREAFISLMGFTVGQTATTFVDLKASPNTIDFQGPNAYTYGRNLMIRYQYAFTPRWDLAIAVEMPDVSATTKGQSSYITPQRMPDVPFYLQYNWDKSRSHIRASGLMRMLDYYDNTSMSSEAVFGWGAMLSGKIALNRSVNFFGQVVYGEGIGNYIQDLNGEGYDLVPNSKEEGQLQTLPTMGWLAGLQFNCPKSWQMNLAYSQVRIWDKNDYFVQAINSYKLSQYIVANVFYNISPAFQVGVEYLYGTREDANSVKAAANRAQMMVQLNF